MESNLIMSWEQIVHLGNELPLLEQLNLSYNKLAIPEDLQNLTEFRTYNARDETVVVENNMFTNLKSLVFIKCGLTWTKLSVLSKLFPNTEELILCLNSCNDFDNISSEAYQNFKNLKKLNLDANNIVSTTPENSSIKKLSNFHNLVELKLAENNIEYFPNADQHKSLNYINLEKNEISNSKIITDLSKAPFLSTIRIFKNPICDSAGTRHVRNRLVGEIKTLTSVNGTEVTRYDRRDFEIYY